MDKGRRGHWLAMQLVNECATRHGPGVESEVLPLTRGILVSARKENIIMGREKVRVFPEPVKAIPIISAWCE